MYKTQTKKQLRHEYILHATMSSTSCSHSREAAAADTEVTSLVGISWHHGGLISMLNPLAKHHSQSEAAMINNPSGEI